MKSYKGKLFMVRNCNFGCKNPNSEPLPYKEAKSLYEKYFKNFRRGLTRIAPELVNAK